MDKSKTKTTTPVTAGYGRMRCPIGCSLALKGSARHDGIHSESQNSGRQSQEYSKFEPSLGNLQRTHLKIERKEWAGDVAQSEGHGFSFHYLRENK